MLKGFKRAMLRQGAALGLTLLMCLPPATICRAAGSVKAIYHAAEESVTVTLTTDRKEKTAVLSIEKDGKYWALAEFERTSKDLFEYTCALPADCPSGQYIAAVTIGGERQESAPFSHVNKKLAQVALDKVNAAPKEGFAAAIQAGHKELAVDLDEFNAHKELLTELYYKYKPSAELKVDEFSVLYQQCLALSKMHAQTDDAETKTFLENHSLAVQFDFERFDALSEDEQTEIINRFQSGVYSEADLKTQYAHWFCLAEINAKRDSSVSEYRKSLLETNAELLKLDISDYNDSADQNEVIRLVMEQAYDTLDEVRTAFYEAVDSVGGSGSGGGSRPSGNNGGGKGSGGGTGGTNIVDWNAGGSAPDAGNSGTGTEPGQGFSDVPDSHWCAEALQALSERGVISGAGNGQFLPERPVTRAEFSKMLILALFEDSSLASGVDFSDVTETDWFSGYVGAAAALGIVTGAGDGTFLPNETVTRQDMAVMLHRALAKSGMVFMESKTFIDGGEISDYAKEAVSQVAGAGMLNGMEDGRFYPHSELSRAQAAKALYEAIRRSRL